MVQPQERRPRGRSRAAGAGYACACSRPFAICRRAGPPGELLRFGRPEPGQGSTDSTRLSTGNLPGDLAAGRGQATTVDVSAVPQTIGRYQVRSILGEGGYGRVFLAYDPQLDRQVALKVARFGPSVSRTLIDAFLREAKVAARLNHPRIVAVYDAGFDPAAGCYIVMEYIAGRSLKQVITAGKVPHQQAARYVTQAAEAVHQAHKLGLVHRDLKPANLLVDADDNIKVADFGLAILEEEQRKHAGEFAGTIAYCSPEQVRGEVHHLDGRSDIWSLGVILYELLTGRRPFGGPSVTDEILHRPPKPPRQIDDKVPAEWEAACLRCLAKNVDDRYLTAADLARDLLGEWGAPREPQAAPQPRTSRSWALFGSLGLVALVALLAAGTALYRRQIPYAVDAAAAGGTPLHLLTRDPKVMFPPALSTETIVPKLHDEKVFLNASQGLILGLGETRSQSFQFSVDISEDDATGETGIFLGYRRVPDHNNNPCWTTEVITLHAYADGKYFVERRRVNVVGGGGTFSTVDLWAVVEEVPPAEVRDATLEVTVRSNLIIEIRWMDKPRPSSWGATFPNSYPIIKVSSE